MEKIAYKRQVSLLLSVLPEVAKEACLAMHGGTAINLFVRDMPRLSVDIDLTYVPVAPRPESLGAINAAMRRIIARVQKAIPDAKITSSGSEGAITQLIIRQAGVQTKIEVTPVLRGCVYEPQTRAVSDAVEDAFGFAEIAVVSFADLYASKIVAALDRQHPRDLFDVRDLLANEGIDGNLRKAFVVYILSHNRPMAEVLAPARLDIEAEFSRGFEGMTEASVTLHELLHARETLIADIVGNMPPDHRRFLVSFKGGEPEWVLLDVPGAEMLPAVQWRAENLAKLSQQKRSTLLARLNE